MPAASPGRGHCAIAWGKAADAVVDATWLLGNVKVGEAMLPAPASLPSLSVTGCKNNKGDWALSIRALIEVQFNMSVSQKN